MTWLLLGPYGLFAAIAFGNLLLMRRPKSGPEQASLCILIPARNEEKNLERLIPALLTPNPGLLVYVFDDESEDATAEVARRYGAIVIRPTSPLPKGWTGKNRACHELAKAATEDSDAEWLLFLDADVYPEPDFVTATQSLLATTARRNGVVSGFPRVIPGRGIEPLFLAWVGWALLAWNPFGLVARSGMSHNRFTNGQFHAWRRDVYTRFWPNERMRGQIMEDVMMGRLMAKEGVPIEVANVSGVLGVKMYETWRETLDGMSKNSYEITGNTPGIIALAGLMFLVAWGWIAYPPALAVFILSGLGVGILARAPLWPALFAPINLTIGGVTMLRSLAWHRKGTVTWKGRTYGGGGSQAQSSELGE